jgi:hypothetical protein
MSTPPAPLHDELIDRKFSFYPPILGIEHNEWTLKEATWSEVVVANTKTHLEVAIPRKLVGSVSQVDEPVMIVGLNKELQYKRGSVWPTERRVVSMPANPMQAPPRVLPIAQADEPKGLSAIMGTGGEGTEGRITKLIAIAFGSVIFVGLLLWALVRFTPDAKPSFVAKDQSYLELNRDDDVFAVTRKLGNPKEDRWKPETSEIQFRALAYPERGYIVILMGNDRDSARYIGAVAPSSHGKTWSVLHGVESARGASTTPLLRQLKPF